MNNAEQDKQQFLVLVIISLLFLWAAPSVWHYTPDGGIYVGTAQSMVETAQYRFNGHPNLHYYPGFSSLLTLPIMVFGVNFHALHLFCAGMVVALLWLARSYFTPTRYGLIGILLPVLMACIGIFQQQIFNILSDGPFLAVVLAALLLWRVYEEDSNRWALIACFLLVAFAPMVRFQGLFLCAAFGLALLLRALSPAHRSVAVITVSIVVGLSTLIPFAAWTWRNLQQFTPHTFNMANKLFFGLKGLSLYAPGRGRVDWIDAEWKYPFYCIGYSVQKLGASIFGDNIAYSLPVEVVFIFIVGITFAGSLRWFKLATNMERVYVILCFLFVLGWLGRSHSLYSTARQMYLPFLPFILVSAGFGFHVIYERLKKTRYHSLSVVLIGLIVTLVLSNGLSYFFAHSNPRSSEYYRNANNTLSKVKDFMDEKADPGVSVATTDWGVMPFTLKRTCYMVLDDESHLLSLQRMNKYQTEYLVILDDLTTRSPYTREMVGDLPQLFELLLDVKPDGPGPAASVYDVDLESVNLFLDAGRTARDNDRSRVGSVQINQVSQ